MKRSLAICCAFLILTLSGCTGRRNAPCQANPWMNEWLLIHVNGQDEQGQTIQQTVLLGIAPLLDGKTLAISFATETTQGDGAFRYGLDQREVEIAASSRTLAFASGADSTGGEMRFFLNERALWLSMPALKGSLSAPVELKLKTSARRWTSEEAIGLTGCRFWHASGRDRTRNFKKQAQVDVSVLGIQSLDAMMALSEGGSLLWLNAWNRPNPFSLFLRRSGRELIPFGGFGYVDGLLQKTISIDSVWKSKVLPTDYPVAFQVNGRVRVSALPQDQELALGRRSFWMGTVRMEGMDGKLPTMGNMVIFHPKP